MIKGEVEELKSEEKKEKKIKLNNDIKDIRSMR
jgi:hypothetical protein